MEILFKYQVDLKNVCSPAFWEALKAKKLALKGIIGLPNISINDIFKSQNSYILKKKFYLIIENEYDRKEEVFFLKVDYVDYFHIGAWFGYPIVTINQEKGWNLKDILYQTNLLNNPLKIEDIIIENIEITETKKLEMNAIEIEADVDINIWNTLIIKLETKKLLHIRFAEWADFPCIQGIEI